MQIQVQEDRQTKRERDNKANCLKKLQQYAYREKAISKFRLTSSDALRYGPPPQKGDREYKWDLSKGMTTKKQKCNLKSFWK